MESRTLYNAYPLVWFALSKSTCTNFTNSNYTIRSRFDRVRRVLKVTRWILERQLDEAVCYCRNQSTNYALIQCHQSTSVDP